MKVPQKGIIVADMLELLVQFHSDHFWLGSTLDLDFNDRHAAIHISIGVITGHMTIYF